MHNINRNNKLIFNTNVVEFGVGISFHPVVLYLRIEVVRVKICSKVMCIRGHKQYPTISAGGGSLQDDG